MSSVQSLDVDPLPPDVQGATKRVRYKTISCRLALEEADAWHEAAKKSDKSLSDFLRRAVKALADVETELSGVATPQEIPKRILREDLICDPEVLRHIAGIHNNINQIARALNTANKIGNPVNLIACNSALWIIAKQCEKFMPQVKVSQ